MNIQSVNKLSVKPGDTIVITVDCGKMPPSRAKTYMQQVADHWRQLFPDPSIQISVGPSTITHTIISLISPNSSSSGSTGAVPLDPVDAYDHAMGVI